MKNCLCTIFITLSCTIAFTQQSNLNDFNLARQKISKTSMIVLGGWSAGNIIYGSIAASQTSGSARYFHQMNAIWNGVTLGLATAGLIAKKEKQLSLAQSLGKQANAEKIFLFNTGLDAAYIAGGFYLKERAKNLTENAERSKGYGESIILQGSALLVFDAILYAIHSYHGRAINKIAEKITLSSTPGGIGVIYRF